ncbi:unnamed protein product [Caenorhabditis auriculariae]|uniref:SH2 domain-containing protein n=1 Tax=Caenorhabditis auriculariae TaxID=2777116 RepID=A0A8S1HXG6_9PELO|nr:unnamed protein product [Caenorhabditis auriculariae]
MSSTSNYSTSEFSQVTTSSDGSCVDVDVADLFNGINSYEVNLSRLETPRTTSSSASGVSKSSSIDRRAYRDDKACDYVLELGSDLGAFALFKGGRSRGPAKARSKASNLSKEVPHTVADVFCGVLTRAEAEQKASHRAPTVLYYLNENEETLPVNLKMHMAIRRRDGKIGHYNVVHEVLQGWKCFRLEKDDEPRFPTLDGLVSHYLLMAKNHTSDSKMTSTKSSKSGTRTAEVIH